MNFLVIYSIMFCVSVCWKGSKDVILEKRKRQKILKKMIRQITAFGE